MILALQDRQSLREPSRTWKRKESTASVSLLIKLNLEFPRTGSRSKTGVKIFQWEWWRWWWWEWSRWQKPWESGTPGFARGSLLCLQPLLSTTTIISIIIASSITIVIIIIIIIESSSLCLQPPGNCFYVYYFIGSIFNFIFLLS